MSYLLRDLYSREAARNERQVRRMDREAEIEEVLVCLDCETDVERIEEHENHKTTVMWRCNTCGDDHDIHSTAFNCCADNDIKI